MLRPARTRQLALARVPGAGALLACSRDPWAPVSCPGPPSGTTWLPRSCSY